MTGGRLNFSMQKQLKKQWCWAAVAASIAEFYDSSKRYPQCAIASACLKPNNCCSNTNDMCNEPWRLDYALAVNDNLAQFVHSPINGDEIRLEIDAGRVIGVRIEWTLKHAHFVSLVGYSKVGGITFVSIADPDGLEQLMPLSVFRVRYNNIGKWTHSYFTKSNSPSMLQFSPINANVISKIRDIKERLSKFRSNQDTTLKVPHDIYVISFKKLLERETKTSMGGFRVVDVSEQGNELIFEFGTGKNPEIQSIILHDTFEERYRSAIDHAIDIGVAAMQQYTLRMVKQPEMNLEAFWLRSKVSDKFDVFLPLSDIGDLRSNQPYSRRAFYINLYAAARSRKPYDDDLMGGYCGRI